MSFKVWDGSTWGRTYTPLAPTESEIVTISASLDGSDQTSTIQAQIDAAPDGTEEFPTIIRFPEGINEGKYHTEGDLANNPRGANGVFLFQNRHNLIIEGPAADNMATFYTEAPAVPYATSVGGNTHSLRRHFWFKNCTNIEIRYIRVEGSNYTEGPDLAAGTPSFWEGGPDNGSQPGYPGYRASWELEHAFDVTDSQNVLIEDCEVDSVWGDGVYLGNSSANPSDGVIVRRLYTHWTGRQGLAMSNCRNVLVEYFENDRGRRAAIDLEPHVDSAAVTDVEIRHCILRPLQTHFAAIGRGDVSRINIHDNTLYGSGGTLICNDSAGITRRSDWTFTDNVRMNGFGSPLAPLRFGMTDDITIDGNTIPISASQSRRCVTFNECQRELVVTNNNFGDGCYIETVDSAEATASGNTFGATCPT